MQPKFVTIPEKKVVGIGAMFISILSPDQTGDRVIPPLWQKFISRESEIQNRVNRMSIGVCEPVPEEEQSHPAECSYMACAEVMNFDSVPGGMMTKVIPAGQYAVFTHKGKLGPELGHTMNYIYGTWLPASGRQRRDAPDLEIYDDRFKDDSDDSEFDIYIPIK